MKTYILVDLNNISHISNHIYSTMSYKDQPTGVIFGVFKLVKELMESYGTHRFVFCMDGTTPNLRTKEVPSYKANRLQPHYTDIEKVLYERRKYQEGIIFDLLREIGFVNLYQHDGYEADDLIARVYLDHIENQKDKTAVVVSSDKDLYQLLSPNCMMWNPRSGTKRYFKENFLDDYGISPSLWAEVKAIGGCASDNLKPIQGIGEKIALQYVQGAFKKENKRLTKIREYVGSEKHKKYLGIIKLPYYLHYNYCASLPLKKQPDISIESWNKVMKQFSMESLYMREING